jgi:hypothetical protein
MMVMLTQGEIADRSTENLGESDRGVVLYRRHLLHQIERIERGEEPMGSYAIRRPIRRSSSCRWRLTSAIRFKALRRRQARSGKLCLLQSPRSFVPSDPLAMARMRVLKHRKSAQRSVGVLRA